MHKDQIFQTVQEIIQDALDLENQPLTLASSAKDIERWDSVANIGIIMSIEQEFGFKFDLSELDTMNTVGDIVEAIEKHM